RSEDMSEGEIVTAWLKLYGSVGIDVELAAASIGEVYGDIKSSIRPKLCRKDERVDVGAVSALHRTLQMHDVVGIDRHLRRQGDVLGPVVDEGKVGELERACVCWVSYAFERGECL